MVLYEPVQGFMALMTIDSELLIGGAGTCACFVDHGMVLNR